MPRGRLEQFPELRDYINQHASVDISRSEMLKMAQKDISPMITEHMVRRIYRKDKVPAKDGGRWNHIIPDDKVDAFIKLIPGRSSGEIQQLAKSKLGVDISITQVRSWKKNHKVPSGYDTRYRKKQASTTKGMKWADFGIERFENSIKTQFKKGNIPKNRSEIGQLKQRSDGYVWIKTQDGALNHNWVQYHRFIWEQAHGPIPEGMKIIFLDGNRSNCKLENLELVSEEVLGTANKWYGLTDDAETNRAILKAAELKNAITKAQERVRK